MRHVYYDGEQYYVIAGSVPEARVVLARDTNLDLKDEEVRPEAEWSAIAESAKLNVEGEIHTAAEWCKLRPDGGILCWED